MTERIHPVMARLRRAIESTDPEVERLVESWGSRIIGAMPAEDALRFERQLTDVARAAEELGEDATAEQIMARARELAAKPN